MKIIGHENEMQARFIFLYIFHDILHINFCYPDRCVWSGDPAVSLVTGRLQNNYKNYTALHVVTTENTFYLHLNLVLNLELYVYISNFVDALLPHTIFFFIS